jgi:ketosteroid isomerase-like protein
MLVTAGVQLAKWSLMIIHTSRTVRAATAMVLVVLAGALVLAASTPQSALDELIAADRAFSAASANTDLVSGLSAMFAADIVIPNPPGKFAEGKDAVIAALRANADNAASRTEWTPVRGGISADATHGFTVGFMTVQRGDGTALRLKYLAYWIKQPEGWRVAAYKRARAGEVSPSLAMMPPALPAQLVPASHDASAIAVHRESLDRAERSFSDEAQKIGLGPAFAKFGSSDAVNLGAPTDAAIVVGAENIAKLVSAGQPATGSTLMWAPDKVLVASSGDLGVTIGMIHPNAPAAGQPVNFPFFTIWRRDNPSAPWRYIAE